VVCWYSSLPPPPHPHPPANRPRHSALPSAKGVHVGLTHTLGVEDVGYCPCSGSCTRIVRMLLKCDGTRAETRFRLSKKRTSPFKSAGASVQSTTGSRGVRISGSNTGYTMFRGSVKSTGYPLLSPVSPSVRHRVPSHFNWTLPVSAVLAALPLGRWTWMQQYFLQYLRSSNHNVQTTVLLICNFHLCR
jgi:hypothetical protein